jgi:hypothetical protein
MPALEWISSAKARACVWPGNLSVFSGKDEILVALLDEAIDSPSGAFDPPGRMTALVDACP